MDESLQQSIARGLNEVDSEENLTTKSPKNPILGA